MLEPNPELSASLQQRGLLAVEPPAAHAPLPPVGDASVAQPQPPLALLVRAEMLTRDLEGGGALRMQVLRQLRAQHARLANAEGMRACEGEIDALHQLQEREKLQSQERKKRLAAAAEAAEAAATAAAVDSAAAGVAAIDVSEADASSGGGSSGGASAGAVVSTRW